MKITQNLVIKHQPNKFYPDKPYVLFIVENGRVGDKLNFGPTSNGKSFPPMASEQIETLEEAMKVYNQFMAYVLAKIQDAKRGKKEGKRPSYHLWE